MRKIIVLFLVALMAITNPVFAEDMDIQSILIYTCEDSFCISIPETIVVGEESYVEAAEVNVAPDKMIKVDLSMPNDYVEIYSVNKDDSVLQVYFSTSDGDPVTVSNPTIATFGTGENGIKYFTTNVDNTTNAIAGDYTGSVMFSVHCE